MDRRGGPSEMFLRGIAAYARPSKPWVFTWESPSVSGIERLLQVTPDGILGKHLDAKCLGLIQRAQIPLVCFGEAPTSPGVGSVDNDESAIGKMAAGYFMGRGYRHFGYYATVEGAVDARCREFQTALRKLGHECQVAVTSATPSHPSYASTGSLTRELEELRSWLLSLPQPAAVLCASDNAALSATELCRELGISVPEQIALLGVDNDVPVCALAAPSLSSVQIAGERSGYVAANLLERMALEGAPAEHIRLPPIRVVTRRSTEAIAAGDPSVARALIHLQANATDENCLRELFDTIGCSRRTLERKFRESIGISPAQAWLRFRLEEAERLLAESELGMENVAYRSGFGKVRQLQVAFRRVLKQTPSHFRRNAVPSFRVPL
ncbi:MAG: substrate-binding domain-containing protein [Polyangiaceae bacterium]|nr:substrate-binding domain-containing protein [Polyangiaceae bacterium]